MPECETCSQNFATNHKLKKHLKIVHDIVESKQLPKLPTKKPKKPKKPRKIFNFERTPRNHYINSISSKQTPKILSESDLQKLSQNPYQLTAKKIAQNLPSEDLGFENATFVSEIEKILYLHSFIYPGASLNELDRLINKNKKISANKNATLFYGCNICLIKVDTKQEIEFHIKLHWVVGGFELTS